MMTWIREFSMSCPGEASPAKRPDLGSSHRIQGNCQGAAGAGSQPGIETAVIKNSTFSAALIPPTLAKTSLPQLNAL